MRALFSTPTTSLVDPDPFLVLGRNLMIFFYMDTNPKILHSSILLGTPTFSKENGSGQISCVALDPQHCYIPRCKDSPCFKNKLAIHIALLWIGLKLIYLKEKERSGLARPPPFFISIIALVILVMVDSG